MPLRRAVIALTVMAPLCAAAAILAFWIGDDTLPRIITRIEPLNSPVTPGEMLKMRFEGDAIRNCPATVKEEISDGKGLVAPVEERLGRISRSFGHFTAVIEVPTSVTASPGQAEYRSEACYVCNPLQRWFPLCVQRKVPFEFGPSPLSKLLDRPPSLAAAGIRDGM